MDYLKNLNCDEMLLPLKPVLFVLGLQIDIVGGKLPSVGRVQITYDGVNGSICTEEWTNNDANLVKNLVTFNVPLSFFLFPLCCIHYL